MTRQTGGHIRVTMSGYAHGWKHKERGPLLTPGDKFPSITIPLMRGEKLALPDDIAGSWAYIAFYRGHW